MGFIFDGAAKRIDLDSTVGFTAKELYSAWKEWFLLSDNSKYELAFRTTGGDPISAQQTTAPTYFLNTVAGWQIRPLDVDHELRIEGNLYSEDPNLGMFALPATASRVNIILLVSAVAFEVSTGGGGGGGIDEAGVRNAMTTQGYTTARASKLDMLDVATSTRATPGQGLTGGQAILLAAAAQDAADAEAAALDAAVASLAARDAAEALPDAAAIAVAVVDQTLAGHSTAGTVGQALGRCDVAISSRASSGEAGSALSAIGATSTRMTKIDMLDAAVSSRSVAGDGLTSGQATALAQIDSRVDVAVSTRATPGQGLTSGQATQLATATTAPATALANIGATGIRVAKLDNLDASVSTRAISGQGLTSGEKTTLATIGERVDVALSSRAAPGQGLSSGQASELAQTASRVDVAVSTRATSGQGLTTSEKTMLLELYRIMGLDPSKPLVHQVSAEGNGYRRAGTEIDQEISTAESIVTVTRK